MKKLKNLSKNPLFLDCLETIITSFSLYPLIIFLDILNKFSRLVSEKLSTDEEIKIIDKEIKEIVNSCAEYAKESPEVPAEELWTDIYA